MKVVDFETMFIEREDFDKKIKQAGACKKEYKKLIKQQRKKTIFK